MEESFIKNTLRKFERRAKKRRPGMRMTGKATKRLAAHIMSKSNSK